MNVSKMNTSFQMIPWDSSNEACDDIRDEQEMDYKQLSYKLFQYRTYKLRGSNGEFRCPFCANYEEEEEDDNHCTRLLLHAIRVAETSDSCKERANHFAMARYLAFDLADQVIAEAQQPCSTQYRKRPRLDEDSIRVVQMEEALVKLQTELNETKDHMNDLIQIERLSNDELQGARRELVKGFNDILGGNHVQFGIKNIGEIDSKVFISAMENRFSPLCAVMKGVELCSLWQGKLTNPQWHPFQIVEDDMGKPQRLLKEDDISLQNLKRKWGREIHDAVVEALNELHEYNPRGCYVIPELWNFKENRKAKLDEVIHYILEAVKDFLKMGSTSDINNSRIKGQRERGDSLKMGSSTSCINDSDEESGISESEIYQHKERIYKLLKSCTYQVRGNNGQLRCPFCSVEQEHDYNYLLRHSLTVAEGSSESVEQRATHFALAKYLVLDLPADAEPPPQDLQHLRCRLEDEKKALKKLWKENEELKSSKAELLEKERRCRDQLRRARKELTKGLTVWQRGNNACIGIKKMGEIDVIAFKKSCKKRFSAQREAEAVQFCSMWQEQLKCPDWHPFRIIGDDKGNLQRLFNENDESLRALKEECGDEAFNAVVIAFKDLSEYSKSRRHIVPVMWNFDENREAEMEDVISFVFEELMAQKRKKTG